MRLVFLGSGQFGIDCLDVLARSSHSLRFIVTQPAAPAGRGKKQKPTPVASWAEQHKVPLIETENVNSPEVIAQIAGYQPELIVVVAFGQKISNELINLPPKSTINVHASLLPKYRGAAPVNWAIINGETRTGVAIIKMVEKMDAGDILAQAETDIEPDETAGRLHDRLARLAAPLLLETLDRIADGAAVGVPQDHSKATLARKLKKSDGFLDFKKPAQLLRQRILGLSPWPGASALYVSKETAKSLRVIITMAEVVENANPGELVPGTLDENLSVVCGRDALKITHIKPEGSALMDFSAFVNGRHTSPGDMFTKLVEML